MGSYAHRVPGLLALPTLSIAEALDHLAHPKSKGVVLKHRSGTEGDGFRVISTAGQLRALKADWERSSLLQPAIEGVEYSVNLITDGTACRVYAPVGKGSNRGFAKHPAKRIRTFPAEISNERSFRLMQLAAEYALEIGARGIVEIEFLETETSTYLIEVNPRLSATLRMSIAGSDENILMSLGELQPKGLGKSRFITPTARSVELPLPSTMSCSVIDKLFKLGNVQISSRVTLTAETLSEVTEMCQQAKHILRCDQEKTIRVGVNAA